MFNGLLERARILAERRVRERIDMLAERMQAQLPRGVAADAGREGVRLSGRGLIRRAGLDAGLRWLLGSVR